MNPREELVTKATEDPGFRERLKADPRGTVAQFTGGSNCYLALSAPRRLSIDFSRHDDWEAR